jgi:O-acetyl-ADP-ribose deacetylase (regulator of RNase III)
MMHFLTGNMLESSAEALVNTVNCEGVMGKGIAYQFKLRYPENNKAYEKACKSGQLRIGNVFCYKENGKIILNFPTKNKWREKSRIEYIKSGIDSLIKLIDEMKIKSVAIPPLGSGNGGLNWLDVKAEIEKRFIPAISEDVEVFIYEPSMQYSAVPIKQPKLSLSALILMQMKINLRRFGSLRLQKTAFFMNLFLGEDYFKFSKGKFGPYDSVIDIVSKDIKAFQDFHGKLPTPKAYALLYQTIVSEKIEKRYRQMLPAIKSAVDYVNAIEQDSTLECAATVLYIIKSSGSETLSRDEIISEFKNWSEDKAARFSADDIEATLDLLCDTYILNKTFTGYEIAL